MSLLTAFVAAGAVLVSMILTVSAPRLCTLLARSATKALNLLNDAIVFAPQTENRRRTTEDGGKPPIRRPSSAVRRLIIGLDRGRAGRVAPVSGDLATATQAAMSQAASARR